MLKYVMIFTVFIQIVPLDEEFPFRDRCVESKNNGLFKSICFLGRNSNKQNTVNQVSGVVEYCFIAIDLFKSLQEYCVYKKWINNLSYHEFVTIFSYLVTVEKHIKQIKNLLDLSKNGSFPEQIKARIDLAQISLCPPYNKIMNDCIKKHCDKHFDESGKFIYKDDDTSLKDYKKFYKKVPQDFKKLALHAQKISHIEQSMNFSNGRVKNDYNQTLLDMIYAGVDQHFPRLKKLCRKYYDLLIDRLYRYYLDQKIKNNLNSYGVYKSADVDPLIQNMTEGLRKSAAKAMKEELILREWYQQELQQWLLLPTCRTKNALVALFDILPSGDNGTEIKELPFKDDYRFILLRNFVNAFCGGDQSRDDLYQDFFLPSGVLKRYGDHPWIKNKVNGMLLHDALLHKAVNFALAISEKELDDTTQKLSKAIIDIGILMQQAKDQEAIDFCKNKIVAIFDLLLYKKYD